MVINSTVLFKKVKLKVCSCFFIWRLSSKSITFVLWESIDNLVFNYS